MTTYTLSGIVNDEINGADNAPANVGPATLFLTVRDDVKNFVYRYDNSSNEDFTLLTDLADFRIRTDAVGEIDTAILDRLEGEIFDASWGNGFRSIVVNLHDPDFSDGNLQGRNYFFQLGGDPLPPFPNASAFSDFVNSITSGGQVPSNSTILAPNSQTPLTSLFNVVITEEDRLYGTDDDDTFSGGIGNDDLQGFGGNDILDGGPGNDYFDGGRGNDTIRPGNGTDYINGDWGFDTIDLSNYTSDNTDYLGLQYNRIDNGVIANVDVSANTLTIDKGARGTDTVVDIANLLASGLPNAGLGIRGSGHNDTFNIDTATDAYFELVGGRGNDTFNLTINDSYLRLDYSKDTGFQAPDTGIVANIAAGTVSNDGFGSSDTVNIARTGNGRLEVRATNSDDRIVGSDGDDRFSLLAGNDTVDGGGGIDLVRYDRTKTTTGVTVDLEAGTATGLWDGMAFSHTLSNIEDIRGANAGPDMLKGNAAANEISARGGNDTVLGGGGNDSLYGQDGNDLLYGQAGNDLLVGGNVTTATGTAGAQVYRIYQATLDRAPDAGGFAGWVGRLESGASSVQDVVGGFVRSTEFQKVYGSLSNSDFVTLLYNNVLDRAPDQGGLNAWLNQLSNGATRESVVTGFSESGEFKGKTGVAASTYTEAQDSGAQAAVMDDVFRLYQATLDRAPDAAGLDGWSSQLADGAAFTTIARGFTRSTEFTNTYGALDDNTFINQLYRNVLDREGDSGGLAGWRSVIDNGGTREDVVRGFAQSGEFVQKTAADFKAYMKASGGDLLDGGAGNDMLYSGATADTFVFDATEDGRDTVLQIDTWDTLQFEGFGYATASDALAKMSGSGAGVRFDDQGVEIVFAGADMATLQEADYLFA